jgi:hypothetical protein
MKTLWTALGVLVIWLLSGVCFWYFSPGSPGNPHDWISDHYRLPACAQPPDRTIVKPDGVVVKEWDEHDYGLLIGDLHDCGHSVFTPLHLEFTDKHNPRQFPDGCWNIDFCIRHGEARVTPCYDPSMGRVK